MTSFYFSCFSDQKLANRSAPAVRIFLVSLRSPGTNIWLPAVCTGIHGFLAKSTGKTGKIPEKILIFFRFFGGFSGPDFAKISAAVARIVLVQSRAPATKFHPISFQFSVFCSVFCGCYRVDDNQGSGKSGIP